MSTGGKGSATRPTQVSKEHFNSNWEQIFGKKAPKEVSEGVKDLYELKVRGPEEIRGVAAVYSDDHEVRGPKIDNADDRDVSNNK